MTNSPFYLHNFAPPTGPVMISVPHAGRTYDPAVSSELRVPLSSVMLLEDRYADRLTDAAIAALVPTIIANTLVRSFQKPNAISMATSDKPTLKPHSWACFPSGFPDTVSMA